MDEQEEMSTEEEPSSVTFKKIRSKKSNFRKKDDIDSDEETNVLNKIEEMKTIQKMRERPNGVSVVTLALGEKISKTEEILVSDPFKVKTGGLINMANLKKGKVSNEDDAYNTGIGTQFSAETNKRDEDDEMMKYIEVELSKRKGKTKNETEVKKYCPPEEAALLAVPDHLRISSSQRNEEMLSNQMLSGIPEVDLGIEAKIKNIEATEEAKLKLLWESQNQKDGPSPFVPTNMAVNFVQHNRFNIEDHNTNKQADRRNNANQEKLTSQPYTQKGIKRGKGAEKATDDYHFEKFKKQYRKYV
ncbi:telomere length and silencing protein 1 homolog isoform X3 [Cimex lectularius]|uniref:Telomere length and silencing protein 1 homolog n=1 Tax=Cimex lectularius TaxID=79782 RepID=A0A8I6RFF9_CIMLE|nr:telomere length and silencing protein 1 homolog isoform X2 [Cimex lectularius]XP_014244904.1 telomere length and silencing protein 1 homolog isoform X3 [Cimex lectularius]